LNQSESIKELRKKVLTLPYEPGVYMMKNKEGKIIYIGKAKNLRKRVLSYFTQRGSNEVANWKTSKLISKIEDIDHLVTDNETEAFLLESNLIKQYRPLFNIDLKDQQRYTYLKISDDKFPRLLVARRNRDGKFMGIKGKVFGPFVHGSSKYLTIGLLRKIFKIRICNTLPKRPCLEYFINNCDAPCINNVTQSEYLNNVQSLENILS
jgi:excinuclease ABC subunit C